MLHAAVVSLALAASSLTAAPLAVAPEPDAQETPEVTVQELTLEGVDAGEAARLPDEAPVPEEEAPPTARTFERSPAPADAPATAPVGEPDVLTVPMSTDPFTVLGLSWDDDPAAGEVVVRYRVEVEGRWQDWEAASVAEQAPDAGSVDAEAVEEGRAAGPARVASEPIVAVGATGLQVWAEAENGPVRGLTALAVDPGDDPTDEGGVRPAALRADPGVVRRAAWGASAPACRADYSTSVVSAAVHHTAGANGYSSADVPGILRGIQAYHMRPESGGGRGWCDIGYNFLVDKFGRIFEGRAGSLYGTVVGVHTGGFNSRTVGVSALGTYTSTAPTGAMTEAISQIIAWKFASLRIDAGASVTLVSGGGASRFPAGSSVTFPTIYAHRDAALTSCPGELLYGQLGNIRARVAQINAGLTAPSPFGNWERSTPTGSQLRVAGWAHDPETSQPIDVRVDVNGTSTVVKADRSRPDLDAAFASAGARHGFDATVRLTSSSNVVCVWAVNTGRGSDVLFGCRTVTARLDPLGQLDGVTATGDKVRVHGWAFDPDQPTTALYVWVTVDGVGQHILADTRRDDVGAAYSGVGNRHGFDSTLTLRAGRHTVCVTASNVGPGAHTSLGCRSVTTTAPVSSNPKGQLDSVTASGDQVRVRGWAFDADQPTTSLYVWVTVNGVGRHVYANTTRADVGRAYPGVGDHHGFDSTLTLAPGTHRICATASNVGPGRHTELRCDTVTTRAASTASDPVGQLDGVTPVGAGKVRVHGWTFDPDQPTTPLYVWVTVDGVGQHILASTSRADVGRAYPGVGSRHGFDATLTVRPGAHTICATASNIGAGSHTELRCAAVDVRS